ncbi:DUF6152 family protein [Candidatus Rariloculus sp.]|uniref:DUF6152 family protein n=1 Tax=Candidatus Rariloculus sp. TaxID=3101265 RepID=UPI003D0B1C44
MRLSQVFAVSLAAPFFFAVIAPPTLAHHGFGTFSMNEDIEITGTVTDLAFVNPHSWLYLDVVQENGAVEAVRCEMRSANTLRRSGWTPELFPVGNEVTITGSPDRNDPYSCYVSTVIFEDGSSLDRYGQILPPAPVEQGERPLRLANGEPNISGDWAAEQRVMTDPRGQLGTLVPLSQASEFGVGGVPEGQRAIPGARGTPQAEQRNLGERPSFVQPEPDFLTEAGREALAASQDEDRYSRSCVFSSIVSEWSGEPINRVTQRVDTILLQYGRLELERTIYMGMAEHPADIEPSRTAHSIGRWEDDVLIVDTVGFASGMFRRRAPHSEQLHVIERFRFDPETTQLRREYTAEDALYWTEPVTGMDALDVAELNYQPELCEDRTIDDDAELGPRQ